MATSVRLAHCVERWRFWLERVDQLQEEFDRGQAAHARRHPHLTPVTVEVDFDKSYTGRLIAAKEQWAHRRARTYGQAVLILRELEREPEVNDDQPQDS